jgi:hypothetical protein
MRRGKEAQGLLRVNLLGTSLENDKVTNEGLWQALHERLDEEKLANNARWQQLQRERGEAAMGRGAGGAASPPGAPQPEHTRNP